MPRTTRRLAALLLAGATLVSLAACAPGAPAQPTPSPAATETDAPIFASDEEALAAAVAAYEAYLAVSDSITADGGANSERIIEVTSEAFAQTSVADYAAFREAGLRTSGRTSIDSPRLLEFEDASQSVSIYACQDVSAVRLLNAEGADVTPADRDDRVPLVIETTLKDSVLKVDGNQVWSGDDFC